MVENRLLVKEGFEPFKQPPRRMAHKVVLKVKDEVERLLKAGFIRLIMYIEWLSNIVSIIKKNEKIQVCIDFKNINLATPKDEC